jgi:hypothetical protein
MSDPPPDPFGERPGRVRRRCYRVLGVPVCFESESSALMALVDESFAHAGARVRGGGECRVVLRLARPVVARRAATNTAPNLFAGAGVVGSAFDAGNFAIVMPESARALVSVTPQMLRSSYDARYELIEFAVLTLLSRMRALVPLHAACFGARGRAVLVLGDSGAGKSTLSLQAAAAGLELVAEDSVFVDPRNLRASGLNAFLYLRAEGHGFARGALRRALAAAPRIRRRGSGVRKAALDLRRAGVRLAVRPLRVVAVVVLRRRPARVESALRPLSAARTRALLAASQPYGRRQPGWSEFLRRAARLPAFELDRMEPAQAVRVLERLLGGRGTVS